MQIVSIQPRTSPNTPMLIKLQWSNGNTSFIKIAYGKLEFVRPVKESIKWHFIPSGYKPNENILKSVSRLIIISGKEILETSIEKLRISYSENLKKQKEFFEKNGEYSQFLSDTLSSIYCQAQNLKAGFKDIESLEANYRGGKNEKVC